MAKLGNRSKKIKEIRHAIKEMYRRLESSYKIDRIVEMENTNLAYIETIYNDQMEKINDLK